VTFVLYLDIVGWNETIFAIKANQYPIRVGRVEYL
jgi:hypothetical protein